MLDLPKIFARTDFVSVLASFPATCKKVLRLFAGPYVGFHITFLLSQPHPWGGVCNGYRSVLVGHQGIVLQRHGIGMTMPFMDQLSGQNKRPTTFSQGPTILAKPSAFHRLGDGDFLGRFKSVGPLSQRFSTNLAGLISKIVSLN